MMNASGSSGDTPTNYQATSRGAEKLPPPPPPLSPMHTESEGEIKHTQYTIEVTPIAPPTNQGGFNIDNDAVTSIDSDYNTEGQRLRRSSRKPVRVRHYSADSDTPLSDSQISTRKRKRKSVSSGVSQSSRFSGKRRQLSASEASGGEGSVGEESEESSAKRVCLGEKSVTVNLEPLELGAKFKTEIEALNREERAVVSVYILHVHVCAHSEVSCMYNQEYFLLQCIRYITSTVCLHVLF